MKIALLTLKFSPLLGGDVTHTVHLGRFLEKQGIETHIITIRSRVRTPDEPARYIQVHRLGLPATTTELETIGIKRVLYMASSFLLLLRLLLEDRLDLIHAHGWDPALVGGLFSRIFGVPLVLTVHGIPRPRKPISSAVFPFLEGVILWLCSLDHSRIVALTDSDAARLAELGVSRERIDVIPNGIDIHEFKGTRPGSFRKEYGISPEAFLALFVGRLHEQKGVEVLLQAAKRLRGDGVSFVVVGSGHQEKKYRTLARELNVDNVLFTGEIAREDLLDAFASSDVFVLPSIFEGMPYVILEAMAAGNPVVASRLPGLTEVIQEGKTGVLFEKGDDEGLAQAIRLLKRDRELARKMGGAGRRLVKDRFGWQVVFTKTIETYGKVLERTCVEGRLER